MRTIQNACSRFTAHPRSVGETYFEHLCAATGFGLRMLAGAIACFVHALLPFLFVHTGSACVSDLHARLTARQQSRASL